MKKIWGLTLAAMVLACGMTGMAEEDTTRLIKESEYGADGTLTAYREYTYYEDGVQASQMYYHLESGQESGWIDVYDEDGFKVLSYFVGDGKYYVTYENSEDGLKQKAVDYDEDGVYNGYTENEYNADGKIIKNSNYIDTETFSYDYTNVYEYDADGKLLRRIGYENGEEPRGKTEYEYNENGNLTKEIGYDEEGSLDDTTVYEYDENGNQIKKTIYEEDDEFDGCVTYEYDEDGNLLKESSYDEDNVMEGYIEYLYGDYQTVLFNENDFPKFEPASEETADTSAGTEMEPVTETDEISTEAEEVVSETSVAASETGVYDFKKVNWGQTREDVIAQEGEPEYENELSGYDNSFYIAYTRTLCNLDALLAYYFCDGVLYQTRYILQEDHSNETLFIEDYEVIKNSLAKKFGEPFLDYEDWDNDAHEEYYQDSKGDALCYGYLSYVTFFENDRTEVVLEMSADNYDVKTMVTFNSKDIVPGEQDYSSDF